MKTLATLLLGLLCVLNAQVKAGDIPEVAYRSADGRLLWVDESVAFTKDGKLRADLFSNYARQRFERHIAENRGKCVIYTGPTPLEIFESMESLDALAAHSKAILAGEVIAARQGFYAENAGTMFLLRVTHTLKSEAPATDVLLFVGSAQIITTSGMICASLPPLTATPAIGDRVLLFAYRTPLDAEHEIFEVDTRKQLVVQTKSKLAVPSAISADHAFSNLEEIIDRVRVAVDRSRRMQR